VDRVLYWYIHSALWGRFAGSTETMLNQDYDTARRSGAAGLIAALERWRGGSLRIDGRDFAGSGLGSRFYPLLYLLTRVHGARDFGSGLPLNSFLTGLQIHHVFPKAVLYAAGFGRSQVNAVANFCFLTQDGGLRAGQRLPEEYLGKVAARYPGALASQWIPPDPGLWRVDRYLDFLAARRELLAEAANAFLDRLRSGAGWTGSERPGAGWTGAERPGAGWTGAERPGAERAVVVEDLDARRDQVRALVAELVEAGCADPAVDCEVSDPATGEVLVIAEACWPEGLQPGQGDPVILELDPAGAEARAEAGAEAGADLARLKEIGYEVFTSVDSLRGYVRRRNREAAGPVAE
jgi:hypothetical protein